MPNFGEMTSQHVIYIPCAVLVGLVVGYLLGARAVRVDLELKRRQMKE